MLVFVKPLFDNLTRFHPVLKVAFDHVVDIQSRKTQIDSLASPTYSAEHDKAASLGGPMGSLQVVTLRMLNLKV